jgi:hypothetical protein
VNRPGELRSFKVALVVDPPGLSPGSAEAREQGCACAVFDNAHGAGARLYDDGTAFWVSQPCPLHGWTECPDEDAHGGSSVSHKEGA